MTTFFLFRLNLKASSHHDPNKYSVTKQYPFFQASCDVIDTTVVFFIVHSFVGWIISFGELNTHVTHIYIYFK